MDSFVNQGEWTPTLSPNRGGTIQTTVNMAEYIKLGKMVSCIFDITVERISGGSTGGTVDLTGLPFSSSDIKANAGTICFSFWSNLRNNITSVSGVVNPNALSANILCTSSKKLGLSQLQQGDLDNYTRLVGTVTYVTSS